jgi:hypothetical protein
MQVKFGVRGAAAVIVVLASAGLGALSQAGPAAAASATPAGPGGTWGQALAVPGVSALGTGGNVADDGFTTAISCTSPGECAAVGEYSFYNATTHAWTIWPLVVSQSGGSWGQAEALPGIAALSSGLGGQLTAVSCASAGNCSATGTYNEPSGPSSAFLVDEVDGTWGTVQPVPDAASLGSVQSAINLISCPSAGDCAAVGTSPGSQFILDEVDGTWGNPLAVPGLASLGTVADYGFDSLSCADAGDCTALGTVDNASGILEAVVVSETGGTWNDATVLPGESALSTLGSSGRSVSCPAAGDCTATGTYEPASGSARVWVADEVNGTWGSAQALAAPLATTTVASGTLSCATPGNCALAGTYEDAANADHAYVVDEVNGTWQASQDVPGLSGTTSYGGAVSCAAPGDCAATGRHEINGSQLQVYTTDEVNGIWGTATALPGVVPGDSNITAMSCTAPGYCSATGTGLPLVSEATGTVTTITVAANDSPAGDQTAPVTVSVTSPDGGTPTGTVTVTSTQFQASGHACTATLSGGTGTCAFPAAGLALGSYPLTATYNGDTTYAASASAATAGLTVTLISLNGPSASIAGQPLTLDGSLQAGDVGPDIPPIDAVINVTRTLAGSASSVKSTVTTDADGDGEFTITDTPPTAGTYTYTATYTSGNPYILSSTRSFTVTVTAAVRTYSGTIRLPKMGLCLDDRGNSASNGAIVQVWKCNGLANQDWQVYNDGTIRHNGLCLDARGYGTDNGTKVQLWACAGIANQQWDTKDWRIHYDNPAAANMVLDDTGHGGNGTQQQIWTNLNGANQYWATS